MLKTPHSNLYFIYMHVQAFLCVNPIMNNRSGWSTFLESVNPTTATGSRATGAFFFCFGVYVFIYSGVCVQVAGPRMERHVNP